MPTLWEDPVDQGHIEPAIGYPYSWTVSRVPDGFRWTFWQRHVDGFPWIPVATGIEQTMEQARARGFYFNPNEWGEGHWQKNSLSVAKRIAHGSGWRRRPDAGGGHDHVNTNRTVLWWLGVPCLWPGMVAGRRDARGPFLQLLSRLWQQGYRVRGAYGPGIKGGGNRWALTRGSR